MNRIWMPQLTLIGADGIPNIANAGNVLRPYTTFGFSLRLPPTLKSDDAQKLITDFFEKVEKPYNAQVSLEIKGCGQGFNCPAYNKKLEVDIQEGAKYAYGKKPLYYGEGGSIPFVNELYDMFP